MPVIRKAAEEPHRHPEMVKALADEIRRNQSAGASGAPTIVEEEVRGTRRIHVTVIWAQWEPIDPEERAVIILDAYRTARDEQAMLDVSTALGLTPEEAKRLGVSA